MLVKHRLQIGLHVFFFFFFFYNKALPNMSHGIAYRYSMMDNWIMLIIFKEIKQPKHPGRLDCTAAEKKKKKRTIQ